MLEAKLASGKLDVLAHPTTKLGIKSLDLAGVVLQQSSQQSHRWLLFYLLGQNEVFQVPSFDNQIGTACLRLCYAFMPASPLHGWKG